MDPVRNERGGTGGTREAPETILVSLAIETNIVKNATFFTVTLLTRCQNTFPVMVLAKVRHKMSRSMRSECRSR